MTARLTYTVAWGALDEPFRAYLTGIDLTGATDLKLRVSKRLQQGTTSVALEVDLDTDGTPSSAGSGVAHSWTGNETKIAPGAYRWQIFGTLSDGRDFVHPEVAGDFVVLSVVGGGP